MKFCEHCREYGLEVQLPDEAPIDPTSAKVGNRVIGFIGLPVRLAAFAIYLPMVLVCMILAALLVPEHLPELAGIPRRVLSWVWNPVKK